MLESNFNRLAWLMMLVVVLGAIWFLVTNDMSDILSSFRRFHVARRLRM